MTEGKLGGASGKGLGGPALRTFFNLAREWSLTEQEQIKLLGLTSRSTFQNWEAGGVSEVSRDTLERISSASTRRSTSYCRMGTAPMPGCGPPTRRIFLADSQPLAA